MVLSRGHFIFCSFSLPRMFCCSPPPPLHCCYVLDQFADSSRHSRLTRWFTPFLLAISMALPSVKSRMLYVQKCRSHPPQLPPSTMWSPTHAVSAVRWMQLHILSLKPSAACSSPRSSHRFPFFLCNTGSGAVARCLHSPFQPAISARLPCTATVPQAWF